MDWDDPDARMSLAATFADEITASLVASGAEHEDAKDAVAAAILKARKSRATDPLTLRGFMYRSSSNAHADILRRRPPRTTLGRLVGTDRTLETDPARIVDEWVFARVVKQRSTACPGGNARRSCC